MFGLGFGLLMGGLVLGVLGLGYDILRRGGYEGKPDAGREAYWRGAQRAMNVVARPLEILGILMVAFALVLIVLSFVVR